MGLGHAPEALSAQTSLRPISALVHPNTRMESIEDASVMNAFDGPHGNTHCSWLIFTREQRSETSIVKTSIAHRAATGNK